MGGYVKLSIIILRREREEILVEIQKKKRSFATKMFKNKFFDSNKWNKLLMLNIQIFFNKRCHFHFLFGWPIYVRCIMNITLS